MFSETNKRIFVAVDMTELDGSLTLVKSIAKHIGGVKLGKEFFVTNGPRGVKKFTDLGFSVFLDLKFHDIPNTVFGAVKAALLMQPVMISIHASGGKRMMEAAVAASKQGLADPPLLVGVTLLTSLGENDLAEIGLRYSSGDQVARLATLAQNSGLDGVVCSANEVENLRDKCGKEFLLIVPGVRPSWATAFDQKRVATPLEAFNKGADYLVIGRPITDAKNPIDAAAKITNELK